jgi:tetratricopeptide (TPR) repeat protein
MQRHTWLLEAQDLCARTGRLEDEAWCMLDRGILLAADLGKPDEAGSLYRSALRIFEDLGVLRGQAVAVCKLADLARVAGRATEARAWLGRLDDASPNLDPLQAGLLAGTWASVLSAEGSHDGSREARRRAIGHFRRGNLHREVFAGLVALARDELARGAIATAEAVVAEAEAEAGSDARDFDRATLLRIWSEIAERRGDLITATTHLHTLIDQPHSQWDGAYARSSLGRLLLRVGRLEEAEAVLTDAVSALETMNVPAGVAGVLRRLRECATRRGDHAGALRIAKRAVDEARAGGSDSQLIHCLLDYAGSALAVDDAVTARKALDEVLSAGSQTPAVLTPNVRGTASELLQALGDEVGARRLRQ